MGAIPYKISSNISNILNLIPELYYAAWDVLVGMDGLGLCLHLWFPVSRESRAEKPSPEDVPFPNEQAAYCVLRHVVFRTLHFNKIVEFVRVNDIINGIPRIGIAGAPFGERVIKHALKYLSEEGILLKINLPPSKAVTPIYGLNLPAFLFFLDVYWKLAIQERAYDDAGDDDECKARSVRSLRAQKLLDLLVPYLEKYQPLFKYMDEQKSPITNLDDFCNQLKKRLPANIDEISLKIELGDARRVRRGDLRPAKWEDPYL